MKKSICAVLLCAVLISLCSCGSNSEQTPKTQEIPAAVDLDLTTLSSTMVYSEVYNMIVSPGDYIGQTVRMRGQFATYRDPSSGKDYFACIIADATACCSQGIEFVLSGEHKYPEDYPPLGTEITVSGEFATYKEGGETFCELIDAKME